MSPTERYLIAGTTAISIFGLAAEVGHFQLGVRGEITELFSLSFEANVPTWYSSALLLLCAVLLGAIAQEAVRDRTPFGLLSAIFAYMSLDEAIEIHEHLAFVAEGEGIFYFAWVIPAAIIVLLLGVSFVPFLWRLPQRTRRRFILAGSIYVGGALLMELPLGYWTESHGADNLVYGLIDWVEETMELVGASLFLIALRHHRRSLGEASA